MKSYITRFPSLFLVSIFLFVSNPHLARAEGDYAGNGIPTEDIYVTGHHSGGYSTGSYDPIYPGYYTGGSSSGSAPASRTEPEKTRAQRRQQCLAKAEAEAKEAEETCVEAYSGPGSFMCEAATTLFGGAVGTVLRKGGVGVVGGAAGANTFAWMPCYELTNWAVKQCGIHGNNVRIREKKKCP